MILYSSAIMLIESKLDSKYHKSHRSVFWGIWNLKKNVWSEVFVFIEKRWVKPLSKQQNLQLVTWDSSNSWFLALLTFFNNELRFANKFMVSK